jgi:hypothetical protein
MPRSRGRRLPKVLSMPRQQQHTQVRSTRAKIANLIRRSWAIAVAISVILTIVGAAFLFLPRVNVDVEKEPDFSSALPNSVTLVNTGAVTLHNVAVSFGLCRSISNQGARVSGRADASKCNGAALGGQISRVLSWEGHKLVVDEKWTLPPARGMISFGTGRLVNADVDYIVSFWSWPIPLFRHTAEFRFATQQQPNGNLIWAPIPVD